MPLLFKTILVPVDFSISSEVAIHKALEIADPEFASVHLVHVRDHSQGRTKREEEDGHNAQYVLASWKDSIEKEYTSVTVHNWVLSGNPVQEAIASKGKE